MSILPPAFGEILGTEWNIYFFCSVIIMLLSLNCARSMETWLIRLGLIFLEENKIQIGHVLTFAKVLSCRILLELTLTKLWSKVEKLASKNIFLVVHCDHASSA